MWFFLGLCFFMFCVGFWFFNNSFIYSMKMFKLGILDFNLDILLDWYSLIFLEKLFLIIFCVMNFSFFYMSGSHKYNNFMTLLIFFSISMVFLIIFPKVVSFLVGWDGLGVTSFLLILYYKKSMTYFSSFMTYLKNRVGDCLIILAFILLYKQGGWLMNHFFYIKSFMMMLLVCSFFTKSAQFPFSVWLPAAMAAPTPVSALVHSSTLVTAGVYLYFRFNVVKTKLNFFVLVMSLITLLVSSILAVLEKDMKKVVALSTLSKMSMIFFVFSLGYKYLGFLHIMVHAMLKSLLFICSGYLLLDLNHNQDIRFLFSFCSKKIIIFFLSVFSLLGLGALPVTSLIVIKEDMMLFGFKKTSLVGGFLFVVMFLTVIYSFRLFMKIFSSFKKKLSNQQTSLKYLFLLFFNSIFFMNLFFMKKKMLKKVNENNFFCDFIFLGLFLMMMHYNKTTLKNMMKKFLFISYFKGNFFYNYLIRWGKNFFELEQKFIFFSEKKMFYSLKKLSSFFSNSGFSFVLFLMVFFWFV